MNEKYARPGRYLDEDDHGRLIEENRRNRRRERHEETLRKIRKIETALEVVQDEEERARLRLRKEQLIDRLEG